MASSDKIKKYLGLTGPFSGKLFINIDFFHQASFVNLFSNIWIFDNFKYILEISQYRGNGNDRRLELICIYSCTTRYLLQVKM